MWKTTKYILPLLLLSCSYAEEQQHIGEKRVTYYCNQDRLEWSVISYKEGTKHLVSSIGTKCEMNYHALSLWEAGHNDIETQTIYDQRPVKWIQPKYRR